MIIVIVVTTVAIVIVVGYTTTVPRVLADQVMSVLDHQR